MSDPSVSRAAVEEQLRGHVAGLTVVRGRELHGRALSADMPAVTGLLQSRFGAGLVSMVADDRRLDAGCFHVHYLFAHPGEDWFVHLTTEADAEAPALVSLAQQSYPASRFEREIRDLFGVTPVGHPDPRPLVRHGFWPEDYFPLRRDAKPPAFHDDGRPFPYGQVEGPGVYEIPVGPVHAGIIEPGHFRFSAVGETIIDLKQRLYFTHKGTEKLFEGRSTADAVLLAERVSGDTTIGHALAFCQAVESAAGVTIPRRAAFIRAILLEMERIYNHIADFGMIVSDTGFAVAHAHCYRVRERLLRLNHAVTGNRLLRGGVVVGGVACELPGPGAPAVEIRPAGSEGGSTISAEIDAAVRDFLEIVEICLSHSLVLDRLERAGTLDTATARDHAVRGYVARASGIDVDARRDHPRAPYDELSFTVPVFASGDAHARALVRVEEVKVSAQIIRQAVEALPPGPLAVPVPALPPFAPAFAVVEGWRGAIVHWVTGDERGRLHRVKIVDPSFLNWPALSRAVIDNIVPDFPLCNKSFNQSYSGNDL
jgi:Ni,Fe-hydrogenase III large subunit/Ni,Fe-hydrogenase III component G